MQICVCQQKGLCQLAAVTLAYYVKPRSSMRPYLIFCLCLESAQNENQGYSRYYLFRTNKLFMRSTISRSTYIKLLDYIVQKLLETTDRYLFTRYSFDGNRHFLRNCTLKCLYFILSKQPITKKIYVIKRNKVNYFHQESTRGHHTAIYFIRNCKYLRKTSCERLLIISAQ